MTAAVLEMLLGVVVLQNVAVLRAPLLALLARSGRHAGAQVRMRVRRHVRHAHRRLPRTPRHAGQPVVTAA